MSDTVPPAIHQPDALLMALMRAIAARDRAVSVRVLSESPQLARQAIAVGASRQAARAYYFDDISHYVYAGDTALHVAAAAYGRAIAEDLVANGAEVGARNRRGAQPLHYAADGAPGSAAWDPAAQAALIEFLIGAGADPNAGDDSGVGPLHRAVRTRCSAAAGALIAGGADLHRRNGSGSTPLHLAVQNTGRGGSGSPSSREEQARIIRVLLDHGARPSDRDGAGRSVVDCATVGWIRELLAAGRWQ